MYNITVRRDIAGNIPQKSEALMWCRPLHGNLKLIMVGRNNIPFPHFFQNGQSIMSMEENIALEPTCANEICALRVPTSNATEHHKQQTNTIESSILNVAVPTCIAHGSEENPIDASPVDSSMKESNVEEQIDALKTSSRPVLVLVSLEENIVHEPTRCDNEMCALRVPTSNTTEHHNEKEKTDAIESSILNVAVPTFIAHGSEEKRQIVFDTNSCRFFDEAKHHGRTY